MNTVTVDAFVFDRALLCEIVDEDYQVLGLGLPPAQMINVYACTVFRSLYDLLVRDGSLLTVSNKRTVIDILRLWICSLRRST